MKLVKVQSGVYRTPDSKYAVIREDYPSTDEFDYTEYDPTWYVVAISEARPIEDVGLPENVFEDTTKRACVAWLDAEYARITSCPHCGTVHEADCPEGHAAWQAAANAAERRHMGGHAERMIP